MSNNSIEIKNSNIGKVITFGSLNLFLTLKLEKEDLKSTSFNLLQNLEDLSFLVSNKKLWEKIELTSKNELINTLFKMNKIKKNKNIISYIVLDKINYNEEQSKFQELLDSVLLDNGLVICSYEVCKCKVSINLKLIYKKRMKKFVIYGEEDYDEEEEDNLNESENPNNEGEGDVENEEKKENQNENENKEQNDNLKNSDADEKNQEEENDKNVDINDIGLFEKIPEEVKFQEFKYLYFYYKDFISGGDLWGKFKLYQIYNFLLKLKKNANMTIIFNFCDDFTENEKYLYKFIKLSDIHLFRDRNKLLNILKKRKSREEEIKEKETERIKNLLRTQKIPRMRKISDSNNSSMYNFKQNELFYSSREGLNSSMNSSFKKTLNKSQSTENIYFPKSLNLKFNKYKNGLIDKNNIFNYLREIMYISNIKEKHPNYNDKLGIYLDEYKRLFIVQYKKTSFLPSLTEYNLDIYPKPNIHNLSEIKEINNLLEKDNDKYTTIIYGCILSCILDECDNYFMYYYYSRVSILKILALKKNKMPIPKDKSFYIVQINKKELNKMMKEENTKQKENGFNNNHFQIKYKGNDSKYYPLMDKFLTSYMQCMVNIDTLKSKNLINEKRKILYDPEYKDIFKFANYGALDINNKKLGKFIMKENLSKNLNSKEKDYKKEFMSKKPEMEYHLPGINGIPEYIVYLNKEDRKRILKSKLPPLKNLKKKPKNEPKKEKEEINEVLFVQNNLAQNTEKKQEKLYEASNKNDQQVEEDANKEKKEKINTDKYKEIKFENTQLEANNI